MKIDLPIKVHNKFEIEVKDVITGEIVQRGYAENIVLDGYFTTHYVHSNATTDSFVGFWIRVGKGTGELDSARTTLFEHLAGYESSLVEIVRNAAPLPSYATRKISILPDQLIGEIITEVGVSAYVHDSTIYTHALIKDSVGNSLTLGPKTNTQEITVYSTIYFVPLFEPGITLSMSLNAVYQRLISGFVGEGKTNLRTSAVSNSSTSGAPRLYTYNPTASLLGTGFTLTEPGKLSFSIRVETSQFNQKIEDLEVRGSSTLYQYFKIDLPTLAENNSSIWSGWEFNKTPIGVGDGVTTEFPLPWDEAWLDKPKTIYVDGVATAVTWTEDTITFAAAPADQAPITGSYWVKYVPKDSDHVLDITFDINYAEGVTT